MVKSDTFFIKPDEVVGWMAGWRVEVTILVAVADISFDALGFAGEVMTLLLVVTTRSSGTIWDGIIFELPVFAETV